MYSNYYNSKAADKDSGKSNSIKITWYYYEVCGCHQGVEAGY